MHRIEAYIRLGLIFVVIISILYLPILFKLKKKRDKSNKTSELYRSSLFYISHSICNNVIYADFI